jgi:S-adenosylmethionine decarboxylase
MDDASPARAELADLDHFVEQDGVRFAGRHLIIDFWQARHLKDTARVEKALREASEAAGATVLRLDLHRFESSGGVTGIAILAESHISIHTWPERGYAAIDIFMCGDTRPYDALPVLIDTFEPQRHEIIEHRRGNPA